MIFSAPLASASADAELIAETSGVPLQMVYRLDGARTEEVMTLVSCNGDPLVLSYSGSVSQPGPRSVSVGDACCSLALPALSIVLVFFKRLSTLATSMQGDKKVVNTEIAIEETVSIVQTLGMSELRQAHTVSIAPSPLQRFALGLGAFYR